jgi:hypothetical protein
MPEAYEKKEYIDFKNVFKMRKKDLQNRKKMKAQVFPRKIRKMPKDYRT